MNRWPSTKARRVLAALYRAGWHLKRQSGSHKTLEHGQWPDFVFAFHDSDELGPSMLARIAKHTGLRPEDLSARRRKTGTQHIDIPPTKLLRQALCRVILAGFGMDSSFLNLSFTW